MDTFDKKRIDKLNRKSDLHHFAKLFFDLSDEEYEFWRTRTYEQLNEIYNREWSKYKDAMDFYQNCNEYSYGTVFKHLHNYFGNKEEFNVNVMPIMKADTVLDYGCGQGNRSLGYYHTGSQVTMMDIDSPMFQMIAGYYNGFKGYGIEFISITDNEMLSRLGRKWDVVMCMDAIHHIKDGGKVLDLLKSCTNRYLIVNSNFQQSIKLHVERVELFPHLSGFRHVTGDLYEKIGD